MKHARNSTRLRVHEDLNSTDPSFKETLDWISTLFLQRSQGFRTMALCSVLVGI